MPLHAMLHNLTLSPNMIGPNQSFRCTFFPQKGTEGLDYSYIAWTCNHLESWTHLLSFTKKRQPKLFTSMKMQPTGWSIFLLHVDRTKTLCNGWFCRTIKTDQVLDRNILRRKPINIKLTFNRSNAFLLFEKCIQEVLRLSKISRNNGSLTVVNSFSLDPWWPFCTRKFPNSLRV